ncbi:hypothetical protein [Gottfriedia acidiceleris]
MQEKKLELKELKSHFYQSLRDRDYNKPENTPLKRDNISGPVVPYHIGH